MFSLLGTGCACPSAPRIVAATAAAPRYAIFNPHLNSPPPLTHESSWPATFAAHPVYDDTYYRITVWDHQGRFDGEHDYRRQVYSVQEGFIQR